MHYERNILLGCTDNKNRHIFCGTSNFESCENIRFSIVNAKPLRILLGILEFS